MSRQSDTTRTPRTVGDGPFCWQSKDALRKIRAAFSGQSAVASAIAVYVALTELASDEQSEDFARDKITVAERAGLGCRRVQDILHGLQAIGLVAIQRQKIAGTSLDGPNVYRLITVHDLPGHQTLLESRGETAEAPKGPATIAQRFNVGSGVGETGSPKGTAEIGIQKGQKEQTTNIQPSLRDGGSIAEPEPNVETLGYSPMSLRDNSGGAENAPEHACGSIAKHQPPGNGCIPVSNGCLPPGNRIARSVAESIEESEESKIFCSYPRKVGKQRALKAIRAALKTISFEALLAKTKAYAASRQGQDPQFTPHPGTWFSQRRWEDELEARTPPPSAIPATKRLEAVQKLILTHPANHESRTYRMNPKPELVADLAALRAKEKALYREIAQ